MSIVRSALAGFATGGRTFSGISALSATVPRGTRAQPDATLARTRTQAVLGVLAAGEALGDKLPSAPSRLDFPGLHGRVVFGALCGVIVARRSATVVPVPPGETPVGPPPVPPAPPAKVAACALVGAAAAVAGSYGGARFRGWAQAKTRHDWIGAFVEDAVVVALTGAAVAAPG